MPAPLVFRAGTAADAPRLAAVMAEGIEGYRAFAGERFQPPALEEIESELAARLPLASVWCELAEQDGAVAGYVSMLPAAESRRRDDDPGLAHFWMLFVRPPWWGDRVGGAAPRRRVRRRGRAPLHVDAAVHRRRAGTGAGVLRARGLGALRRPFVHDALHLDMVEYRRPLSA